MIIEIVTTIKSKKFTKKKPRPENEITGDDLSFFLTSIKNANGYPKIRDLQKLLGPRLSLVKINSILRYLEKSKMLETDLDGNIIWIREEGHDLSLAEVANISHELLEYISRKDSDSTTEVS
jgi:hypothetical protein